MIYGYARVSSAGQAIDGNSLEAQSELLKANGAQKIFSDVYTGTKLHRPELDKLMAEIQPGDTLIVAKLDRIARSAKNGLELIDQFIDKGVSVNILNMGASCRRWSPPAFWCRNGGSPGGRRSARAYRTFR